MSDKVNLLKKDSNKFYATKRQAYRAAFAEADSRWSLRVAPAARAFIKLFRRKILFIINSFDETIKDDLLAFYLEFCEAERNSDFDGQFRYAMFSMQIIAGEYEKGLCKGRCAHFYSEISYLVNSQQIMEDILV